MEAYTDFAYVYDTLMDNTPYKEWCDRITDILRSAGIKQDLVLDLDQQAVVKQGEIISLTYTEYKILELLATHRKKIYSLENIYQSVWDDAVGDSTIMVHIKNLRKKIGDDSRSPKYIKTAWGKGYYVE